jgi:colanic acid/amylovoran biosynthesis glycosyltransferase
MDRRAEGGHVRISIVVESFPSLSETFILSQMIGLIEAGHEVRIFAGSRSSDLIMHEDVIRHGLLARTKYYHDKPKNRFVRFLVFLRLLAVHFHQAPMPLLRTLNPLRYGAEAFSLNYFFRAIAFLRAREDEVILCHFGQNGLAALILKETGLLKGKLVTAFHASDITSYVWKEGRSVYAKLFKKGDLFLPVSKHARGKLLELGCPERKITVHRMGIDMDQFQMTARKRFGTAPLRVLSVARLVEKKGIRYGIEALRTVLDAGVQAEYTIIGDGALRSELEALTVRLAVKPRVRFLGWQEAGAIRRALRDADIFLAPSIVSERKDEEGIPVVLMEAMASGVPVVTTSTGGIRELVTHGKTGFLVPERDARILAEQLISLWQRPGQVEAVVREARKLIEEQYNVGTLNQILDKVLTATVYGTSEGHS